MSLNQLDDLMDTTSRYVLINLEEDVYYTYSDLSQIVQDWDTDELLRGQDNGDIVVRELGPVKQVTVSVDWHDAPATEKPVAGNPAAAVAVAGDPAAGDPEADDG